MERDTYRDEQIRNQLFILSPALSIFCPASLNIPPCSVQNHNSEEDRIEPREWTIKSSYQTPRKGEIDIARIVDLASVSIPAIGEDGVTIIGGDGSRVVKCLPW